MPVAFISDFGPMPAIERDDYTDALGRLGREIPRPKAVLVMSGHWEARETLLVTSSARPEIIYDYYGFPEEFYQVRYPCPGDPETAGEAVRLLTEAGFPAKTDPKRGLDHGAWVPLSCVYPEADVPIIQMTVPSREAPSKIIAIGRALAPLRERGVLIVGAGAIIHNLSRLRFGSEKADDWAEAFDAWFGPRLDAGAVGEIADYERLAPSAKLAVPTPEHFDPLFFVLGAADGERPTHYFRALRHGSGLLRAFVFGMNRESGRT
jgi:4,5-DOPA dioxygenase extradiol